MKPWARELALGLLLSVAIPSLAVLAADPAEQILLDKANFWRLKDRPDLAIDALNKLLTINPNQPDALYQYGMLQVQQGNVALAGQYLARLQAVAPSNPRVADLENAIRAGQVSKGDLNEARRLAQSGQFAQAAQKYQQTFRGPPPTTFGVEYYLTLAGTANGWDEARRGLEHLAQVSPGDSKVKMALAQVLTYRDTTRYDGIAALTGLSRDPVVGAQAVQAWRQALMWLGTSPRDRQLYDAYLAQYPQDTQIRQHVADAGRLGAAGTNPLDVARSQGYADLQHGNSAAAERAFETDLRARPGDPDALAGLGIIRLREQRFGEARDLLGRAMRAAPGRQGQWAAAYDSAAFYAGLQEAKAARAAGNYARARTILSGLVSRSRSDNWDAEIVLGDVDSHLGDHAAAEQAYRRALAAQPQNVDAAVGLFNELTAEGKTAEAQALADRLNVSERGRLTGANRVRAEIMRTDAKALETRGEIAQAMAKYQAAIAADPNDPWARLDFARFLARQGEPAQALQVVDPAASGNTPASLQAAAIFYSEQNRLSDALATIDRIPPGARNADINAFRERILVTAEIDRAKQLAQAGNRAEARNVLITLYSRPPMTADKTRLVVDALADIGETDRALQIARESVARGGAGATKATIDYAGLLLRSGRSAEAGAYITQLESGGRLGGDDLRDLENLKAEIAARRADQLRQRGDLAGAYDQISPLLAAYPNNPTLLLATGRLYADAGEDGEAMRFFDAAYQQRPNDLEIIRGAVGGAIMAKDLSRARAYLAHGAALFPNNPRLYFLEAEIARASGDNGTAMRALLTARALNAQQAGASPEGLPGTGPATPGTALPNPFRHSQSALPQAAPFAMAAPAATEAVAADPAVSPIELAAVSADSDDLTVPPHAGERPGRAAATLAAAGSAADGRAATRQQVADLEPAQQSFASPLPAPDIDASPQRQQVAQLEPLEPPPIPGYQPPPFARQSAAPVPQDSLDVDIQHSMAAIEAANNPTIQGGLSVRGREGEVGLSQLTDIDLPIETSFSPFYTGTVRLAATPTFLSAGTPESTALVRFGSDPLLAARSGSVIGLPAASDQTAGGVGLSAGYSYRNVAGEVGSSPLGFPVDNLLGRLAFAWPGPAGNPAQINYSNQYIAAAPTIPLAPAGTANPIQVRVEGSREPVTDSLLSYAGTRDPASGATWGGVVRTGGDVLVSYDDGGVGLYALGGGGTLDGRNVESNTEFDATVGGFIRPYRTATDSFKVGVNLTYFSYDQNLRFFTFGQGGYFSPQNYLNVGIPLEYSGRDGRFTYLAGGALGIQTFNEKSSPFLPTDPGGQAELEAVAGSSAFYPSRTVTGPSFSLRGQLEYALNNGFAVGGYASVDNAQDYTEGIAKVYLRKTFGIAAPTGVLPNTRPGNL